MLIVTQDRIGLINLDNVLEVYYSTYPEDACCEPNTIRYFITDKWGNDIRIGEYEDTPEHQNLITKIAEVAGAINVFYMPEE